MEQAYCADGRADAVALVCNLCGQRQSMPLIRRKEFPLAAQIANLCYGSAPLQPAE